MTVVEIIDKKRRGGELSAEELGTVVLGYARGEVPDYQAAAWLMAVAIRGMSRGETFDLTRVMVASGATLDLSGVPMPVADKHSSGGVGDKITLVVAPLVRACGVAVGKMSGRGLATTGGTIDKLESIPGFRVDLSAAEFVSQLEREGIVVSGQSPELAPADGKLYALRDVTGTVQSIPLIASSIMSKKLAISAQALVLDVKVGAGAFMRDLGQARELASLMVELGKAAGKRVTALLSPMEEPLGEAVGNALEVAEAIEVLRGRGPDDVAELAASLAGEMLYLAGRAATPDAGKAAALETLRAGRVAEWLQRLIAAQGGDPRVVDDPGLLPRARVVRAVPAPAAGAVTRVDALDVARVALELGAGRLRKGDPIDHGVGVVLKARTGARVAAGDVLAEVHAKDDRSAERAAASLLGAYALGPEPPPPTPLVLERIGG